MRHEARYILRRKPRISHCPRRRLRHHAHGVAKNSSTVTHRHTQFTRVGSGFERARAATTRDLNQVVVLPFLNETNADDTPWGTLQGVRSTAPAASAKTDAVSRCSMLMRRLRILAATISTGLPCALT